MDTITADAAGTRFLEEHARWFVHRSDVTLPETIYDKQYYDRQSELDQDKKTPIDIRLHLQKYATIRNGHAPQKSTPPLYDFKLRRMLRHEIVAGLLTHYAFDNKQQFLDVCRAVENKIASGGELSRCRDDYQVLCDNLTLRHNLIAEHGFRMKEENPAFVLHEGEDIGTKAAEDLDEKFTVYTANILAFKEATQTPHRIGYDAKEALERLRNEWANVHKGDDLEQLITPVLIEEERIRWKERELWKLLCGEDEYLGKDPSGGEFEKGLLARTIKELADAATPTAQVVMTGPGIAPPKPLTAAEIEAIKAGLICANLRRLKQLPKETRKSQLVVGGSGAGKSVIIKELMERIDPHEGTALLNTDWVKSILLEEESNPENVTGKGGVGEHDPSSDPTQLGTITHAESAHVIDLAARHWQKMAKAGRAPNLLAELTKAGDWRKELGAGETDVKVWVVVKPVHHAVRDAYVRGLQPGDDKGRFPPTENLLESHAAQFQYNLDAIVDGFPLEFVSLPDEEETTESAAPVNKRNRHPQDIAEYKPDSGILEILIMPKMLEYFRSRQSNTFAYSKEGLWQGTSGATVANLLKYAEHMKIDSVGGTHLAYNAETHRFDFAVEKWNDFCDEMQDDQGSTDKWEKQKGKARTKEFLAALAEQYVLDEHGKRQFLVNFRLDPAIEADLAVQDQGAVEGEPRNGTEKKTAALLEAIVAESKSPSEQQTKVMREIAIHKLSDMSLRFQELGRELDKASTTAVPPDHLAEKLKQYANTLELLATGSAQSTAPDFRCIECDDWIKNNYPLAIGHLRENEQPKRKELGSAPLPDLPEYLVFDTRCGFGNYMSAHERLDTIEWALKQEGTPKETDMSGIRLLPRDMLEKYFDEKLAEKERVSLCAPKAVNNVVAYQVDNDRELFTSLPTSLDPSEVRHALTTAKGRTKQEEKSEWIVMPRRYAGGIKDQLAAFDLALENKQWAKALHCLFHANGQPRFPCRKMSDADFRKEFRAIPHEHLDRLEKYKEVLAVVLDTYTNSLRPPGKAPNPGTAVVRIDQDTGRALIMVRPEKQTSYNLPSVDGKSFMVKGRRLFGIEVSRDPRERRQEVTELRRKLTFNENIDPKQYPLIAHSMAYVMRCPPPEMDGQEVEMEAPEQAHEADRSHHGGSHGHGGGEYRFMAKKRPSGMPAWGRYHNGPHRGPMPK